MNQCFSPDNILESYAPSEGVLLEFIAPYIHTISELMAEKDPTLDANQYGYKYICSFIRKAKISVGFIDTKGFIQVVSPSFNRRFKQKLGKDFNVLFKNIREIFEEVPKEIANAFQKNLEGSIVKPKEISIPITKEQKLWIRWESFPWLKTNGEVSGIVFFCKDITAQKELYLDVRKLYSRAELLEKFSLIFSHDLIQPFRQISTYVSFLELELGDTINKNQTVNENIKALRRCVSRAKDICEGIIVYCKNGDLTINREPVNLSEVMDTVIKLHTDRRDVSIRSFIPRDLVLDVNRSCVFQLFSNLLDNAIKHSTNTPIDVTLSGRYLGRNYYEFSLHNKGWCSQNLKQKNVFNTFYSDFADGAGLGLILCKKIIDSYGGEITFISLPEGRAKLKFSLPIFIEEEHIARERLKAIRL